MSNTASARPANLAAYRSHLQGTDSVLRGEADDLLTQLRNYQARCPRHGADLTPLAYALGWHASAMATLDQWVGEVGEAFQHADGGSVTSGGRVSAADWSVESALPGAHGQAEFTGPNAGTATTGPGPSSKLTLAQASEGGMLDDSLNGSLLSMQPGEAKAYANLFDANVQGAANYGMFSASGAADANVGAEASANLTYALTGIQMGTTVSAGLRASASGEADLGILGTNAKAEGLAGGEAQASLGIGFNSVGVGAGAFAGARYGGEVGADLGGIGAGGGAEGWAGAGAKFDIGYKREHGKIEFDGDVGVAWVLGGNVSYSITLDPAKVGRTAVEAAGVFSDGAHLLGEGIGDGAHLAADVGGAVGKAFHKITPW